MPHSFTGLTATIILWAGIAAAAELRTGHVADASGRETPWVAAIPSESIGSRGALVFLHADDGAGDYAEWVQTLASLGERHGLVVVALREPEAHCWWAPHAKENARWLLDVIDELLVAQLGVDPRRLVLAGKSGGGFFAAGVPYWSGGTFTGAIVGLCGGDVPRLEGGDCDAETDAPEAPRGEASGARFRFVSTRADEWASYSIDAAAHFSALGDDASFRFVAGGEHCEFDLAGELAAVLEELQP